MMEKEDRNLNNLKTYSRSPLNKFKHSDLDIFMKIHEDSISADSSKSKDDNSQKIQRNRRKSARTKNVSEFITIPDRIPGHTGILNISGLQYPIILFFLKITEVFLYIYNQLKNSYYICNTSHGS